MAIWGRCAGRWRGCVIPPWDRTRSSACKHLIIPVSCYPYQEDGMTSHDRIKAALEFRELDSIPITETAVWPDTLVRWHSEELPEGVDVRDYFRLDRISAIRAFDCSLTNVFPHTIYEETDDYVIDRNGYGVKVKYLKHHYATHIELDHAVKEHADWTRCKGALDVSDRRMATGFVEQSQEARQKGDFISLNPMDFFWFTFVMLGTENFMIQMAADPDFIHDIFETYTDFLMEMLKRTVATAIEWDAIWFYSDMAYRNGPLFSPKHYREFLLPRYRRVREFCDKHGKFLLLHTDGNVEEFMPCFIESGFNAVQPLEARAGNDVRVYKPKYGSDICFFGNISADVLATGDKEKIEEEVGTKVTVAKQEGGYIYHSDHSIPPTVSFESFSFAIECARKYGKYV
ncbi:MAG: hypothetical protein COZ56_09410 [Armatimonadetes bacterium CG_4_8_14_3_um_filter_58_9]|nr:MAG: hypothetical protein COZ56_09410 [Armatimonadetes bacterium CG_4_8_14_3_um_filter_58_9]